MSEAFQFFYRFLDHQEDMGATDVGLVFLNFTATIFNPTTRPPTTGTGELPDGFRPLLFLMRAVAESLHPQGTQSPCDWAYLAATLTARNKPKSEYMVGG